MKGLIQKLSKHWTLAWMIAALAAAGAFVTLADYTGVNSIKRVVSTQASSGVLFSSNSLKDTTGYSKISSAQRLSGQQYDITVCNYEQIKAAKPNPEDITYTLTATLQVRVDGNFYNLSSSDLTAEQKAPYIAMLTGDDKRSYTVKLISDDGSGDTTGVAVDLATASDYTWSFTDYKLKSKKNELSTDMFQISFDEAELAEGHTEPDIYIAVKADPSSPSGINPINNLYCASQSAAEASAWNGELLEKDSATVDYDFYNYILTGSGTGTIDVMWDTTMFEINPFFRDMEHVQIASEGTVPVGEEHAGWARMTLEVDSTVENRFAIQFYKISDTIPSYTERFSASEHIDSKFPGTAVSNDNNGDNEGND